MKGLYRGFVIAMILLALLGMTLFLGSAWRHTHRPLAPSAPSGSAWGVLPHGGEASHV